MLSKNLFFLRSTKSGFIRFGNKLFNYYYYYYMQFMYSCTSIHVFMYFSYMIYFCRSSSTLLTVIRSSMIDEFEFFLVKCLHRAAGLVIKCEKLRFHARVRSLRKWAVPSRPPTETSSQESAVSFPGRSAERCTTCHGLFIIMITVMNISNHISRCVVD